MTAILCIGDQRRHRYLAAQLHALGLVERVLIERRGAAVPTPPAGLARPLAELFERHFRERDAAERRHFGAPAELPGPVPRLVVEAARLNGPEVAAFLQDSNATLLLSYGVHKLSGATLEASGARYRWNLHGGLSPWYRGCITHFWPTYLLEPQMTGCTVHELTDVLDQGPVVHQTGTRLVRGDGLHDTACRAVLEAVRELPRVVETALHGAVRGVAQPGSGRLWRAADWRPEHLVPVYRHHGNRIVDRVLDGELQGREPELVRLW